MRPATEDRREALRNTLIDLAEAQIAGQGMSSLKARTLAQQAGCSVGALYNAVGDLPALVIMVNGRTFLRLGQAVSAAIDPQAAPADRLIAMSLAYLHFASNNTNLWRCLFDLEMSVDQEVPTWYLAELERLFAFISDPLMELSPDDTPQQIGLMTRALFSSVHGIVLLGLEKRISAVPLDQIEAMIALILRRTAT